MSGHDHEHEHDDEREHEHEHGHEREHGHRHDRDHGRGHRHDHRPGHAHAEGHTHGPAHAHDAPPSPYHRSDRGDERNADLSERVAELESLLIAKGLVTKEALDKIVEIYEHDLGPLNGARVVARAWTDPAFKRRLLEDATSAIAELGYGGLQGEHMVVVENTPQVHNVVVCTLCSCYPWPVLGLPPAWYKEPAYRSRIVIDPRSVLRELGTELGDDVEVRVWDSSSEVRYLVLPERPPGTEGSSEAELAALVDRDAMIGVTKARAP